MSSAVAPSSAALKVCGSGDDWGDWSSTSADDNRVDIARRAATDPRHRRVAVMIASAGSRSESPLLAAERGRNESRGGQRRFAESVLQRHSLPVTDSVTTLL